MTKMLTILGMVVAIVTLLIFLMDAISKFPFGGANIMADVGFIVSSIILGYLSFSAFRDT